MDFAFKWNERRFRIFFLLKEIYSFIYSWLLNQRIYFANNILFIQNLILNKYF